VNHCHVNMSNLRWNCIITNSIVPKRCFHYCHVHTRRHGRTTTGKKKYVRKPPIVGVVPFKNVPSLRALCGHFVEHVPNDAELPSVIFRARLAARRLRRDAAEGIRGGGGGGGYGGSPPYACVDSESTPYAGRDDDAAMAFAR
jgi:hypothetical protein